MMPTDNKAPKVSELIEQLQRCNPDDRVKIRVDSDRDGGGSYGEYGIRVARIIAGNYVYVQIVQDAP